MKITEIKFAGETGLTARLHRRKQKRSEANFVCDRGEFIVCEISNRDGTLGRTKWVATDDRDAQFSMAELLQNEMDGYKGTNSEIHDYFRQITLFAD